MAKFRKKPVVIDAVQWTAEKGNLLEITQLNSSGNGLIGKMGKKLIIPTLEGEMTASLGDWIIKGVSGELYPCKPDIFKMTYESV